ncbi:MAG: sugar ABC transporter permease [Thermomicrobium sp.]|nr:sugar ABC transporter permease [Thermomicrobium sp.]
MVVLRSAERTAVPAQTRVSRLGRDFWLGYALTLPAFLVVVGLVAYPLGYAFWLSLQDIKIGGQGQFVGLGNYVRLLVDSDSRIHGLFWNSVKVTLLYTGGALAGKFVIGMVSAVILNAQIRARHFWRTLLFVPWAIPAVVSAFTWRWMYNDVNGVINTLLTNLGLVDRPILFLADPNLALWSVLIAAIWQGAPFWTMTFLAGLQAIPRELYEAASIDGATPLQQYFRITLPLLTPVITVTVMLSAIWTSNAIQYVYILTNGGPANATETFPLLAYHEGMQAYDLGIASAIPLVFFPVFAILIYFLTRRMLRQEG